MYFVSRQHWEVPFPVVISNCWQNAYGELQIATSAGWVWRGVFYPGLAGKVVSDALIWLNEREALWQLDDRIDRGMFIRNLLASARNVA